MVKYINKLVLLLSIFLIIGSTTAAAAEPSLSDILNTTYGVGHWVEINQYIFNDGGSQVVTLIRAEYSSYANPTGWYDATTGVETLLLASDAVGGTANFQPNVNFGMYTNDGGSNTFYTEMSKNADGLQHARIFMVDTNNDNTKDGFAIAFEDTLGGGDNDFNDVVIQLTGNGLTAIPEFPTVALPIAAILGLAFIFQRRKDE